MRLLKVFTGCVGNHTFSYRREEVADEEGIDKEFIVNGDAGHAAMGVLPMVAADSTNFPQLQVKKRVKANFERKRTHNEQVLVAPCGVILARETFYGAEAISSCVVSKRQHVCYVVYHIDGTMPWPTGIHQAHILNQRSNARPHLLR
jgi:hypothetical protein